MVLRALQWLKKHNKYYQKIKIDCRALSLLPDDGNLTGLCEVMMKMGIGDEEELEKMMLTLLIPALLFKEND